MKKESSIVHENLVAEYLEGSSVISIAKKYKITREAVYLHLRKIPNWRRVSDRMRPTKEDRAKAKYQYALRDILKLAANGYSAICISKRLKVPFIAVQHILKGTKFENSKEKKNQRNELIYESYINGSSQQKIAKAFGMAQSSISEIIRKWHLKQTSV